MEVNYFTGVKYKWTEDRTILFKQMYPSSPWEELTSTFQCSKESLETMASALGINRARVGLSNYSEEEIEIIRKFYTSMSINEIVEKYMPYRSAGSVQLKAERMGLIKKSRWSEEEDKYLRSHYPDNAPLDVASAIGKSENAVNIRARMLGLHSNVKRQYFTKEDDDYIRAHYLEMDDQAIGLIIKHSKGSVKERRRKLGLLKPQPKGTYENLNEFIRKNNSDWKRESMESCKYKCAATGDRFDDIHHIYGMNMILDAALSKTGFDKSININDCCEEDRIKLINTFIEEQNNYPLGVCLRHDVHQEFHNIYGYGDNTPEQFKEFLTTLYPQCGFVI